jgi:DNA-3-methyladenine glycosylase II
VAERAFTLEPSGPFTLAAASRFFGGWEGGAGAVARGASLRVAFLVDDWSGAAGLVLRQAGADQPVDVEVAAGAFADPERVRDQIARVLSLDHDARGYAALGERDPVVGARQRTTGGLRPVLFHSPYEAACWAVISARVPQAQARRVRSAMGTTIEVAGERLDVFPTPQALLIREEIAGLTAEKVDRLHGIARAALDGLLDRERLLALDPDAAIALLQRLRGIGPFWAALIVLRAVGPTDALAPAEPRLRAAVAAAYGRTELESDDDAFVALAESWRPYRTWVSVLMRATSTPGSA